MPGTSCAVVSLLPQRLNINLKYNPSDGSIVCQHRTPAFHHLARRVDKAHTTTL
jgi:hypothetical protein